MHESGRTKRVEEPNVRPAFQLLDLGLLRDLQRVIYLDPKVSNGAFQLGMTEQDLDCPWVLRLYISVALVRRMVCVP